MFRFILLSKPTIIKPSAHRSETFTARSPKHSATYTHTNGLRHNTGPQRRGLHRSHHRIRSGPIGNRRSYRGQRPIDRLYRGNSVTAFRNHFEAENSVCREAPSWLGREELRRLAWCSPGAWRMASVYRCRYVSPAWINSSRAYGCGGSRRGAGFLFAGAGTGFVLGARPHSDGLFAARVPLPLQ